MFRTARCWMGVALIGAASLYAAKEQQSTSPALPSSGYRMVLNQYCVSCHNEKLKTAGLMLDKVDIEHVSAGAEVLEKVVRKLRTRAMPPAGMPRPDTATYDSLAKYLETALDDAAAAKPNPGTLVVHRLNRAEYTNAIRDLLALDIDGESLLPADDSSYGFDNMGASLSVSPTLLEKYMSAAEMIDSLAFGNRTIRPDVSTYNIPKLLIQEDRMSEDLPFGSRGGIAIRYHFPLDGDYTIKIRLRRQADDFIVGLDEPHQLEIRLDGARIKRFTIGKERTGNSQPVFPVLFVRLLKDPSYQGVAKSLSVEQKEEEYEHTADASLEFRFPATAGTHLVGVTFLNETAKSEGALQPPLVGEDVLSYKGGNPGVSSVTIGGPYNSRGPGETASRRRILACRPTGNSDEDLCAKKILSILARRAYRRPITDGEVQTLMGFYKAGRNKEGFEVGIGMALQRMLVDPNFLFRIERDPADIAPGTIYRINDLDLASRLSFFLWSSIPDDQLLDLAARGKLKDPLVLEQQVRRMLADSRSTALVRNFAGQWLYVRNMRAVAPDQQALPDFDENLREVFQQETDLFLESMLRSDNSVLDLLRANYTFVNERLARHYQIPNVYGSRFRRVTLNDENRWGLLGQGSILTVTSYANRTSPTVRGKWLLENLLGAPPPPPPPDVNPALADHDKDGKILTVRQQMEQHRANPVCASCHARMDPLGFALENFDAIGKWRTTDGNAPIDASAVLPDGTKFQGPAELRKILLSKPEQFVTAVTEKLLTYAVGRGVGYYDQPAVRKIVREAAPKDHRWSSLILGIVKSTPFQMRIAKSVETTTADSLR